MPHPDTGGHPSASNVFTTFLKLGLTSFGGPLAHIGYFHREIVERRRWVTPDQFAQLLALCQFLPGPASSQLGFGLGLLRAGWRGALAAFVAFTLPSAALLFAAAVALPKLESPSAAAVVHGLKIVALAVVAHGVLGMARKLCTGPARASIAAAAAAALLVVPHPAAQIAVVALGAAAGTAFCRRDTAPPPATPTTRLPLGPRTGAVLLAVFALLLAVFTTTTGDQPTPVHTTSAFYRAGALVFGGGHVVLPLLETTVVNPGWLSADTFLAGYGAAQAVPGPMFTIATFLGASLPGDLAGLPGAALATAAIFLPGFLLLAGALPLWQKLAAHPTAASAVAGVNATVVGLLAAALYDPVFTAAVRGPADLAVALVAFTLLVAWRASALVAVAWCVAATVATAAFFG